MFWKPGWVQATREEFYPDLLRELFKDSWIMDGNYTTTLPWRLERCDLVLWFDLPRLICMWGVLSRVLKYRRKKRPDMGEACPEKIDREFLKYTWDFKKTLGVTTMEMIRAGGKPCVTFRSRRDTKRYLYQQKNHTQEDSSLRTE